MRCFAVVLMAIVVAMPPEGGPSAPPGTAPSAPPGTAPSAPPGKDMWSGVALENVRKNTICLVKDKTDANLAQLKRAGGHWHSKDEFVQLLTVACIDYGRSFGVSAA